MLALGAKREQRKGRQGIPGGSKDGVCFHFFTLCGTFLRDRLSANALFSRLRPQQLWLILGMYFAESLDYHLRLLEDK